MGVICDEVLEAFEGRVRDELDLDTVHNIHAIFNK